MYQFIQLFFKFFTDLTGLLSSVAFDVGGITVSYLDLIIGFLALSMIISAFWKGVRA